MQQDHLAPAMHVTAELEELVRASQLYSEYLRVTQVDIAVALRDEPAPEAQRIADWAHPTGLFSVV